MQAVFDWISHYGYAGLFGLLVLGIVGLPVPDETLLTFCGYLIWKGRLHPVGTFLAGFGGSLCGISVSYLLGRVYGTKVIHRYGRHIGLNATRLDLVHRSFARWGRWVLAIGYFVPGVRHFTALVAGTTELRWPAFALSAYSGAALWVATFLTLGYTVGEEWHQTSATFHKYSLVATGTAIVVLAAVWLSKRPKNSS